MNGGRIMAEYIEREAVNSALGDACKECLDSCVEFLGNEPDCNHCLLHGAIEKIIAIPAADVAPVRHGKWKDEADYDGDSMYVCSECGETWTLIDGTPIDNNMYYCPHCGARMDGEDHG